MQVKEFMLPGQHKLGKHRPAKPFGKDERASLFRGKRYLLFLIHKKGKKLRSLGKRSYAGQRKRIKGKMYEQVIKDG